MNRKVLSLIFIVLLLVTIPSFAHNAEYIEMKGTVVKFQYDNGDTMYGATLLIQDAEGNTLKSTFVKEDGLFDYGSYVGEASKIVVNDGGGHLVEFIIPETVVTIEGTTETVIQSDSDVVTSEEEISKEKSSSSMVWVIGIAVIIVAVVAVYMKNKKKSTS